MLLLLIACQVDQGAQGTAVGNPTGMTARLAEADGLTWVGAATNLWGLELLGCDGEDQSVVVGQQIDLLDAPTLTVPAGTWCGIDALLTSNLDLDALGPDSGTAALHLDVGLVELRFEDGLTLGDESWILEIGAPGWTSAEALGVEDGAQVVVLPGSELGVSLAHTLTYESAIYLDSNEDGALSDDDRDEGTIAESEEKDKEKDKDKDDDDDDDDDDDGQGNGNGNGNGNASSEDNGRGRNNPSENPGRGRPGDEFTLGVGRQGNDE